jgi:hypothetical protein
MLFDATSISDAELLNERKGESVRHLLNLYTLYQVLVKWHNEVTGFFREVSMDWQLLLVYGFGNVLRVLERALDGLTPDDLDKQPHPDSNSMGWLTWHLTRYQDERIADFMRENQLWVSEKWHTRFNRSEDPKDTGIGHSSEQVRAFKSPEVATLLGYHRAVQERTKLYILSLSLSDLDREISIPGFERPPKLGGYLVGVLSDNLQHAGQVAYLRGLLKGKGWTQV